MKVLFVSSGNKSGGKPTNLILAQGESLLRAGVDLDYFTLKGNGIFGYLSNFKKLREYLKDNPCDVIHAHYVYSGIISWMAKGKHKLIVSLMGSDLICSKNQSNRMEPIAFATRLITKIWAKYFFDFTIVKSKEMGAKLFRKTKYDIIPNGVDFDVFYPIDMANAREVLGLNQSDKIVLFAADPGRTEKNYKLAEEAIKNLNNNIKLLVVYNISQKELNNYYNAADLILLTSLYEGSPNVIKEALACNRVIVSTDVGDVRDNLKNVNGCFITSFKIEDVMNKIKLALDVKKSNARNVISHLNSTVIAKTIINYYEMLLISTKSRTNK